MSVVLELANVAIALPDRAVISDLDLTVRGGEVVTVMGPSGSGKSTLLSFIAGFLDPAFKAGGKVTIHARDVTHLPAEKRRIGILFQDDLLFPHLSVGDNLAFGLAPDVKGRRMRRAAVEDALDMAGLSGFAPRNPATLSGGQRARVALLRTLLARPDALLLDEPFAKLDLDLRAEFRTFVFAHARQRGLPTLLVTHDPADAEAAGGPILSLAKPSLRI